MEDVESPDPFQSILDIVNKTGRKYQFKGSDHFLEVHPFDDKPMWVPYFAIQLN
jgi:hypothetical protein